MKPYGFNTTKIKFSIVFRDKIPNRYRKYFKSAERFFLKKILNKEIQSS